jgi:hypothetical protein
MNPRFAHVINPVAAPSTSDLSIAQPVTFESMRAAQQYARSSFEVELYAAFFPEDERIVPPHYSKLQPLDRSILDVKRFNEQRKLPLIRDILERLYQSSDAEYLIYTNVDIALVPHFYIVVAKMIENGCDAASITRRTISKNYVNPADLPLMCAQVGQDHPGNDCFVFRRDACKEFDLRHTCIGTNFFPRVLLLNMIVQARNFQLFRDLHLTFHLGDDRAWKSDKFADYLEHQKGELRAVLQNYHRAGKLKDHPLIKKWMDKNMPRAPKWRRATRFLGKQNVIPDRI